MQQLARKYAFFAVSFEALLRRILYLFTFIAVLAFGLYVFTSLKNERENLLSQIATQADFTAANAQSFFDNIGDGLEMAALQVTDKYRLDEQRSLFETVLKRNPEIAFISVFDADGRRLFMSFTSESLRGIDRDALSGQNLPQHFADNFESIKQSMTSPDVYTVGRNEYGKLIKQWRIPVRYAKHHPDGSLNFIVQAAIPISRQTSVWSNLGLLPNTRIGLYRDDGFLQTRWPDNDLDLQQVYGQEKPPQSPMEEIVNAQRERGYYEGKNSINEDVRLGAYRRLAHTPLTAYVSVPTNLVYQNWWQHNYALTIVFVLLFSAFFGFGQVLLKLEKVHSSSLAHRANTDSLTELPNRQAGESELKRRAALAPSSHNGFAVLFIDLDKFKTVNDTYGHQYGDLVLKHVTARLKSQMREYDMLARLGGDEFMAIINCASREEITHAANRLMSVMAKPISIEDQLFDISLSVGISFFPEDGRDEDSLLNKADTAMYSVKNSNRNGYAFYNPGMSGKHS